MHSTHDPNDSDRGGEGLFVPVEEKTLSGGTAWAEIAGLLHISGCQAPRLGRCNERTSHLCRKPHACLYPLILHNSHRKHY